MGRQGSSPRSFDLTVLSPSETSQTSRAPSARDYIDLLKPRVMSLVVFTGAAGVFAAPGTPNPILAAAVVLAIAAGAGGAGALNMWFDADIDAGMSRTRMRPVPAGLVPREEALMLGLVMSGLGVLTAALAAGPLAAGLLAFSIWFYAVLYTQWLKRRTAQNIVIGGFAGALPPAIGWAGMTNAVPLDPWLLVAIIFLWTPPHFWALALYRSGDYAKVGVPMLPVTKGHAATRRGVFGYTLLLALSASAPCVTGLGGALYLATAGISSGVFVLLAWRLLRAEPEGEERAARNVFAFSILYLFLLFGALLAEHAFGLHVDFAELIEGWVR